MTTFQRQRLYRELRKDLRPLPERAKKALQKLWGERLHFLSIAITVAGFIALAVTITVMFSAIIPYDMDEFIHYHPLFCHYYPFNILNSFRGSCHAYDLDFLSTGIILPLRSFDYTGSFTAILYAPLFLMWRSPLSARLLCMFFLGFQSWILGKLFHRKVLPIFLGLLLFFPYFFQHLVDTGPVSYQITTVYLLYLLFQKWHSRLKARYAVTAAVVFFCGMWVKPTELLLLPGIGALFCFSLWEHWGMCAAPSHRKTFVLQCLLFGLTALLLSGILLLSTNPSNPADQPLLRQIVMGEHLSVAEVGKQFFSLPTVRSLLNPLEATHRIYEVSRLVQSVQWTYNALLFAPLLLAIMGLALRRRAWRDALKSILMYAAFAGTLFVVFRTEKAWAMHHTVLAFPFLILSTLFALDILRTARAEWKTFLLRAAASVAAIGFVAVNLTAFAAFPFQKVRVFNDRSKIAVNTLLHSDILAKRYFYVIADWGMYYYQGLYGSDDQGVLYMRELRQQAQLDSLRELAAKYNRKLLFVLDSHAPSSDLALLTSNLDLRRCTALPEKAVWQVVLEHDTTPQNPCFEVPAGTLEKMRKMLGL